MCHVSCPSSIQCSRTLQMHVCEESRVVVPFLYHKIGELTNCLPSHWLLYHLQQEGEVTV